MRVFFFFGFRLLGSATGCEHQQCVGFFFGVPPSLLLRDQQCVFFFFFFGFPPSLLLLLEKYKLAAGINSVF
jgi:hypothetical protein